MTSAASSRRALAVAAAEGTCPRCGAPRAADQRYCLSCGFALPSLAGRLPGLRRAWIRRFGWYPGDWVWAALPTLLVAAAATAGAIVVSEHRQHHSRSFATVTAPVTVAAPSSPSQVTTTAAPGAATVDTSTLPKAPEPGVSGAGTNGRTAWPAGESGWTIVLVSYPKALGQSQALATATRAAKKGLNEVGVIDSSDYASLQPGYLVVFTGIYGSKADADAAVSTARQAGFGGAYSRQTAR
jgi:hypothetical protein